MACRFASSTDEYHGRECSETEGACMFLVPDEKKCFEKYGEGPLAFEEYEERNLKFESAIRREIILNEIKDIIVRLAILVVLILTFLFLIKI